MGRPSLMFDELNDNHKVFVSEYVKDFDPVRAYKAAFDTEKKKLSTESAATSASRLLRNVKIQTIIADHVNKVVEDNIVEAKTVLKELARIGLSDIREAFDENGNLLNIKALPEDVAKAVASIEVEELYEGFGKERINIGQTKKLKFWDKNKALENLAKHLKLLTDRIEVHVNTPLADRLKAARERVKND